MKYLDMENASLEITICSIKKLRSFLRNYFEEINKLNFKRVTIDIKYININDTIRIINELIPFEECNFLLMIKTNLKCIPNVDFSNLLIINTSSEIFNNDNIYNQILLNDKNIKKITNCLHENINVIVEPVVDVNYIKKFNDLLSKLYDNNLNLEIFLGGFLIPISLIKEHPCNAYLCDGWKCGKKISQLPKVIFIDKDDTIYPHKIKNEKVIIGRLTKNSSLETILINYFNSEKYNYLKDIEKKVFIKYVLNYPYSLFPLDKYIEKELDHDQ